MNPVTQKKPWLVAAITVLSLVLSCQKKDEEKTEAKSATSKMTETSEKLNAVYENMLPHSLSSSATTLDEGPCAKTDGFFDCQPELLKMYMGMAKEILGSSSTMIKMIGEGLGQHIQPGSSGTLEIDEEGDDVKKINYDMKSDTKWDVILHTAKGPFVDLAVDGSNYTVQFNQANEGTGLKMEDGGNGGAGRIEVAYVDDEHFDIEIKFGGMGCQENDVRAPQNMIIKISRDGAKWQGKAMLYMPRWIGQDPKCSDAIVDASKMFFYTDFVASEDNATAAIYLADHTVTTADKLPDHEASDFCTNHPTMCNNGQSMGDPNPVSSYTNPFCASDAGTNWGSACEGLPATDFSSADEWELGTQLSDLSITLRSSL